MGIKVNFTDVETNNFDAIPAGTYVAKITDGTMVEVKNSGGKLPQGTPGINWEFTIQEGDHQGRKQWTNTWLAENSMWALKGLLEATGRFTEEQLGGDLDFDIEDVIGSDVKIVVTKREYNGDFVNDVKRVKAMSSEGATVGAGSSLLP